MGERVDGERGRKTKPSLQGRKNEEKEQKGNCVMGARGEAGDRRSAFFFFFFCVSEAADCSSWPLPLPSPFCGAAKEAFVRNLMVQTRTYTHTHRERERERENGAH
mmetsp:Transcript_12592/g.24499  ORF Transcript_12592/g.24499 Transcript_12592/m.24499 type:complete len:106 (+) Transcript_12592:157-474(+)